MHLHNNVVQSPLFDGFFLVVLCFVLFFIYLLILWRWLHCSPSIDPCFYYLVRFVSLLSFTCQFVSRTSHAIDFLFLGCGSRNNTIPMETVLQSSVSEFLGMMEKPFIFDFDYMFWMEIVILLFNCFIHCSTLTSACMIYSYRNCRLRFTKKGTVSYIFLEIAHFTKTMKIHFNRQHYLESWRIFRSKDP